MAKQPKILKLFSLLLLLIPCFSQAQFVNYGIVGGIGVGGPVGKGLSAHSGINPEIGWLIKYNWTEKISFRTFLSLDYQKFTFTEGKQVKIDFSNADYSIEPAPDYSFTSIGASQHADVTYILVEDKLDISAGAFWGIGFIGSVVPDEPRVFYGATDEEILDQPDPPNVFQTQLISDSYVTELYASDQIQHGFRNVSYGLYAAVTGGTDRLKIMLRYDFGLKNFYSAYSSVNRLGQNYLKIGLIYFYNN